MTETGIDPKAWLDGWKSRWSSNRERSFNNAMMDSGWSLSVAEECNRRFAELLQDLVNTLATVQAEPADFFDRPVLAACIEAAAHVRESRG